MLRARVTEGELFQVSREWWGDSLGYLGEHEVERVNWSCFGGRPKDIQVAVSVDLVIDGLSEFSLFFFKKGKEGKSLEFAVPLDGFPHHLLKGLKIDLEQVVGLTASGENGLLEVLAEWSCLLAKKIASLATVEVGEEGVSLMLEEKVFCSPENGQALIDFIGNG